MLSLSKSPLVVKFISDIMKLISIITKNTINASNKEQIKKIAVQTLIKRRIKEIEITKYSIKNYNKNDLEKKIVNISRSFDISIYLILCDFSSPYII